MREPCRGAHPLAVTACGEQAQEGIGEGAGKREHKTSFLSLPMCRQRRQSEDEARTQRKVNEKFNTYNVTMFNAVSDVFPSM